jgi:hypothetical protein
VILIFAAHGVPISMRASHKDRNQRHDLQRQLNKIPGIARRKRLALTAEFGVTLSFDHLKGSAQT